MVVVRGDGGVCVCGGGDGDLGRGGAPADGRGVGLQLGEARCDKPRLNGVTSVVVGRALRGASMIAA